MNVSLFDIRISLAFDHELLYNKFKAGINKNEVISCGVYVLFVAWHNHPSRSCRGNCAGAHIHLVRARGPLSPHCQPGWRPPLASDSAVSYRYCGSAVRYQAFGQTAAKARALISLIN